MSDVNKTTHVGTAITNPSYVNLSSGTSAVRFTLKFREVWRDGSGKKRSRDNFIDIETLGKNAHWVKNNVKAGRRYHVDGYVRTDEINNKLDVRVRSFNINEEDDGLFQEGKTVGFKEAYRKTQAIIDTSNSLEIAKAKIEVLNDEL